MLLTRGSQMIPICGAYSVFSDEGQNTSRAWTAIMTTTSFHGTLILSRTNYLKYI